MTSSEPFKWRHFKPEIILLNVRWYLRYSLSYRDLEEMMLERGLEEFAATVRDGLETLDWLGRREVIQTLVKRVEVYPEQIKVVFRVGSGPLASRTVANLENSSHRCERVYPSAWGVVLPVSGD